MILKTTNPNSILIVLSGPSGVGKDAVLSRMKEHGSSLHFVITATTRPQRNNEIDGKDYFFISKEKFKELKSNNFFIETAIIFNNYYASPYININKSG